MDKYKPSKTQKELLRDGSFVIWCLHPSDELTAYWNQWIENHPEHPEELYGAKQILKGLELNRVVLSEEEIASSFLRLTVAMKQRKRKRTVRLWMSSAASVVLLCLALWGVLQSDPIDSPVDNQASLLEIDRGQTEIELQTSWQGVTRVDNKATIYHRSEGTIEVVGKREKTVIAETQQPGVHTSEVASAEKTETHLLKVPVGRRASLVLSDGTEVWVNSETVLSFPPVFDSRHRTIVVNGEVFLKVKKDEQRPFIVKTTKMEVKVTGTSFNLSAYDKDHSQSIVLAEGSVEVKTRTGDLCRMVPGERVVVDTMGVERMNVDIYKYTSWKDGLLYFEHTTMAEVLCRLSHYYRVNFEEADGLSDYKCSGKLILFNSIDSVMTTLKDNFPISYHIAGDTIKLSKNKINRLPM